MNTKPILAFDCACVGGTVALATGDRIVSAAIAQGKEATELVSVIDDLMQEAGVSYDQLGSIATTIGPGSFTGIRIGLAVAHGLVLAKSIPLKTISTLEAMAWQVARTTDADGEFHIALRAGKGEIYTQKFGVSIAPAGKSVMAISEIALLPEAHAAWDAPCFGNQLAATNAHFIAGPDAKILCGIAANIPESTFAQAMPLYIRPPDAMAATPPTWLKSSQ